MASGALALVALAEAAAADPHDALITKHASANGVPEALVRRVILIESNGNPRAVNSGNYGLMQIRLGTARALGYDGTAEGLLDADTNMTFGVKYLAIAYRAAGCSENGAIVNYQRGFYGKPQLSCGPQPQLVATEVTARAAEAAAQRIDTAPADVWPKMVRVLTILRPQSFNLQASPPEVGNGPSHGEPARSKPVQSGTLQLAAAPVETRSSDRQLPQSIPLPARRPEAAGPETVARAAAAEDAWPPALTPPKPEVVMLPMPQPRPEQAPKVVAGLGAVGSDQSAAEVVATHAALFSASSDVQLAKLDARAVPLPLPRPAIKSRADETPKRETKSARRATQPSGRSEPEKAEPSGLLAVIQKLTPPGLGRSDSGKQEQPALLSLFQKLTPSAEPPSPRR